MFDQGLFASDLSQSRSGASLAERHLFGRSLGRLNRSVSLCDSLIRLVNRTLCHHDVLLRLMNRSPAGIERSLRGRIGANSGIVLLPGKFVLVDEELVPFHVVTGLFVVRLGLSNLGLRRIQPGSCGR